MGKSLDGARGKRATDAWKELARLERKHITLKERVAALDAQLSLTPEEQVEIALLKKKKLQTKDQLEKVRKTTVPPPRPSAGMFSDITLPPAPRVPSQLEFEAE